jgi:EAL domain-containing protein (putative c-di-GMP-specific phosphodiesterase class I)
MSIVAEGVETFEELAYLQAATRIHHAQGYHFSKPFLLAEAVGAKRVNLDGRTVEAARAPSEARGLNVPRAAMASRMRRV